MGLDAYLNKNIYIGACHAHNNVTGEINIKINDKPINIDFNKVVYIEERIAYWRNAYHIHHWFETNSFEYVFNEQATYMTLDHFEFFLEICKDVQDDPELRYKLLPLPEHLIDIIRDEDYFWDIEYTIKVLSGLIADAKNNPDNEWEYVYSFSY